MKNMAINEVGPITVSVFRGQQNISAIPAYRNVDRLDIQHGRTSSIGCIHDQAAELLGFGIGKGGLFVDLVANGEVNGLRSNDNLQLVVTATGLALAELNKQRHGVPLGEQDSVGHSLGDFAALENARRGNNVNFTIADQHRIAALLSLVNLRGSLMGATLERGGMTLVKGTGMTFEQLQAFCDIVTNVDHGSVQAGPAVMMSDRIAAIWANVKGFDALVTAATSIGAAYGITGISVMAEPGGQRSVPAAHGVIMEAANADFRDPLEKLIRDHYQAFPEGSNFVYTTPKGEIRRTRDGNEVLAYFLNQMVTPCRMDVAIEQELLRAGVVREIGIASILLTHFQKKLGQLKHAGRITRDVALQKIDPASFVS